MSRTLCRVLLPFLVALPFLGCSSGDSSGPGLAVETFYRHLNDENFRAAVALYNAEARGVLDDPNAASASGFAEWARMETKEGKVESVRIVREEAEATSATVQYEIVYRDGTHASRTVTMTLEDGEWKLGLIG